MEDSGLECAILTRDCDKESFVFLEFPSRTPGVFVVICGPRGT